MADTQQRRIILNIGGTKFETSATTLTEDPSGLLASIVGHNSPLKPYNIENIYTYFVDRDPRFFSLILNYLRNGCDISLDRLPSDIKHLKDLEVR